MRSASPLLSLPDLGFPDLGFQFSPGLAPARETALLQSLTSSLPPGADVRAAHGEGSTRVAVWLRPAGEPGDDAARAECLAGLSLLRSGESFAVQASAGLSLASPASWFAPQSAVVTAGNDGRSVMRLLPREILIAGGEKIVLDYRGGEVGTDGLSGGGTWAVAERMPALAIVSPEAITAEFPELTCMAQFRLRTTDLRPPFREVRWTAAGVVANPRARSTPIMFDVRGARPHQILSRRVWAQVTDADGLIALAHETAAIRVTWNDVETVRRTGPVQIPATCGCSA